MTNTALQVCTATTGLCLWFAGTATTAGRDFRINQLPNGVVLGCIACHTSPAGGTARNPFGQAVSLAIGGSSAAIPFWTPALAGLDSDGDGFCNGEEVGDPDGDGTARPGATVTNPGSSASKPGNSSPTVTSLPVLQAVPGIRYEYQATGSDRDTCQTLTYSKVAGPAWLTVSAGGLASGTPPHGPSNSVTVTIRLSDNGSPALSTNQTYELLVYELPVGGSAFEAWQLLNFNLPSEAALAGPLDDPDGDAIVNLLEYAYRLNPRDSDVLNPPLLTFSESQHLRLVTQLRDDDDALTASMDVSDSPLFSSSVSIAGSVGDPTPGDGWKTWTFEDSVSRLDASSRFARVVIKLLPAR